MRRGTTDRSHVPVTMGSVGSTTRHAGPFAVTDARFPAGAHLDVHTHERVTFAVMVAGSFDLVIAGRRLPCPAGTVFTEPGGERHANAVGTGGAHVVVLQPDPAVEFPAVCARMLDRVTHLRHDGLPRLARRLVREMHHPDAVTPLELQAVAYEMLAAAARVSDADANGDSNVPAWFARVEELIHDRFREPLRMEQLAVEAGVHPSHLARVFRSRYGASPGAYLRRLRLEWAADRLAASDAGVSTVALEAGFADQSHFTRAFRRRYGVPPARYRQMRS